MSYQHLLLDFNAGGADGVVVLTLNRPEQRNAIHLAMQAEIQAALKALAEDASVRAVVITGAGDKAFSGGYDIHEMRDWDEDELLNVNLRREPWIWEVASHPKPLIGAINGAAHGAGAIIATAFDIRVGCSRSNFRYTATSYGGANNTWQLPPVVGWAKAKEFLLTARRISAEEAYAAGLLNHLVADDQLLAKAIEIAAEIAAHPPAAASATKRLMHEHLGRRYEDAYRAENAVMTGELKPRRPDDLFTRFKPKS